ncbi:unnamed protein product [Strongylus vulgaris]|uniref:Uncharacterized protein n=1 Tax=Strongylus vulgaris TaxID=40348 RepID=A0A3P7IV18_STRVU|nr:unnamed protein product [Strongylus vulgaris]
MRSNCHSHYQNLAFNPWSYRVDKEAVDLPRKALTPCLRSCSQLCSLSPHVSAPVEVPIGPTVSYQRLEKDDAKETAIKSKSPMPILECYGSCANNRKDGPYCDKLLRQILKTIPIPTKCVNWVAFLDARYFASELSLPVNKRSMVRDYCPVSCNYCGTLAPMSSTSKVSFDLIVSAG